MNKLFLHICALAVCCIMAVSVNGQIETPAPSPFCEVKQTVGLTDVMIHYNRPGVKGRVIFAEDGLVPFGEMWRTGANAATKFVFSDDVKLAGQDVKEGTYAMVTIPGEKEWKLMLFPYESGSWSSYKEKSPAVTLTATPKNIPNAMESFTIFVNNLKTASATIDMAWENTLVSLPLEVTVDERVMKSIEQTMAGVTAGEYYTAASYFHDNGKDLNQALEWIQMATSGDDPKFWHLRREALILADMKNYKGAIAAAEKSKALAEKADNKDYVRMNTKSIEEWSKLVGGKMPPKVAPAKKEAKM